MGVTGLSTYIEKNSQQFLTPYKLCDTYLVVDGNNILMSLMRRYIDFDSAFGGDFDGCYRIFKNFFQNLLHCNVTPIVIFDGGLEEKKIQTVLSRKENKLQFLSCLRHGFSSEQFLNFSAEITFFDVSKELNIFTVQCDLEADVQIAAVANALNCPVLSSDSDFFIFDVLYIPFKLMGKMKLATNDSRKKVTPYLECMIYNSSNLLNKFKGLDKSLLPIVAAILGNDYGDSSLFHKIYYHIPILRQKFLSLNQCKISSLLDFMKSENLESITNFILFHTEKKNSQKILKTINSAIKDYTDFYVSPQVIHGLKKIKNLTTCNLNLKEKHLELSLPPKTCELYYKGILKSFIMDMLLLGIYFTAAHIENIYQLSCHYPALDLIKAIYYLLIPYKPKKVKSLKIYMNINRKYKSLLVQIQIPSFLQNTDLGKILKLPKTKRLNILLQCVGFSPNDIKTIFNFKNGWIIFNLAFLYWIKQLRNTVTHSQIHALFLMAMANQVVQKATGYYTELSKFMKKKWKLLQELSNTQLTTLNKVDNNFEELLANVTEYECLLAQKNFILLRKTTDFSKKQYAISILHLFSSFQSCLDHIMQLNALLDFPLENLRLSDFYSGTLLFNLYININSKADVNEFPCHLMKEAPNLIELYKYICLKMCKFCTENGCKIPPPSKKKGKKKSKKKVKENLILNFSSEDDKNLFTDEKNPFYILQNTVN